MAMAAPATLDDDADYALDELEDLDERLARLRATKPAAWVRCFGRPAVLFTSYELVHAAFKDETTFPSAEFYGNTVTEVMGRNMQAMEGGEHRVNRALASPGFRQRLMPPLMKPLLEPVAHELIDRFESRGRADLVAEFTRAYPAKIILAMLGLPQHAEDDVTRWALGMLDIQMNYAHALSCSQEFEDFVRPHLNERRENPGDDLLSKLATEAVDGQRLTDTEIFAFLKLLFPAGADTTYLGLGSTIYALLKNPDQLARVVADPEGLCAAAAEEGVRWSPPVPMLPRRNRADVVWNGVAIPAGTPLIFGIGAANRDPEVFPDGDRFDIDRRPQVTLTFGFGVHYCLGVHLARAELEIALQVLLTRLPRLRFDGDGSDVRIGGSFIQLLRGPNKLPVRFD
ncbi:MAG: cytochrome P450 [Actinobacteria bacterium]|jgi:cytochrome P450|nr:MAG: cytochrome P450 [Actinomycetota bacterium]